MAINYSCKLSLKDIFTDKNLKGKLPMISVSDTGRVSSRTILNQVYTNAVGTASRFYNPLKASHSADKIILDGTSEFDLDEIVDQVYINLLKIKGQLSYTANYTDVIKSAMKEAEKNKRTTGIDNKLYLRTTSLQQIEGANKRSLNMLMNDVIQNIIFGDDYPETKKKFKLTQVFTQGRSYDQRKRLWEKEVGLI